jgi:hypothetical protein
LGGSCIAHPTKYLNQLDTPQPEGAGILSSSTFLKIVYPCGSI